jgi:hypothetical protein
MKYKNFEDYLQTKHAEQYYGLDDDMSDDYIKWEQELEPENIMYYAQKYGEAIKKHILGELSSFIETLKIK